MYIKNNKLYIKKMNSKITLYKMQNNALYLILLFSMWILFAFNTQNNDRNNYVSLYSLITDFGQYDSNIEIGFQYLMNISGEIGLTYEVFQIILASICLIVISFFIKKYSMNPFFSLLMYAIFPFIIDTIQIRNTLACIFIILGLSRLFQACEGKDKVKNIFFYIFYILLAVLFHKIAFIYFVFLFLLLDNKQFMMLISFVFITELFVIFLLPQYIDVLGNLIPKVQLYIKLGSFSTRLSTKFLFIVFILIIPLIYKLLMIESNYKDSFIQFNYKLSIICGLFYFLYIIDVDFFRIYRNVFIILFIGMCNLIEKISNRGKRLFYKLMIVGVALVLCFFFIAYSSDNVKNLFLYNSVLSGENL